MLERMISGVQRTGRTRSQPASKAKTVEPEPIAAAPECPKCGKPMAKRTARRGKNPGQSFWGCTGFPACRGTRPMSRSSHAREHRPPSSPQESPKTILEAFHIA
ncbi:MAG: topoisomerase DNA-binding C4 zinc finger domain-containing protein [Phycisphaeraceae bacterium]|nr:topoisomerase DNA-binding C4 zinc finger domain-containing protein [Phycisphaeraceae bacterium]